MKKMVTLLVASLLVFYLLFTAVNIVVQREQISNETFDIQTAVFDYDEMNDLNTTYNERVSWIRVRENLLKDETDESRRSVLTTEVLIITGECLDAAVAYNIKSTKLNPEILTSNKLPVLLSNESCL